MLETTFRLKPGSGIPRRPWLRRTGGALLLALAAALLLGGAMLPGMALFFRVEGVTSHEGLGFAARLPDQAMSESTQALRPHLYRQVAPPGLPCRWLGPALCRQTWAEVGLPHAQHADIARLGGGRFSLWNGWLVFSTPDGTDARAGGYWLLVEAEALPLAASAAALLAGLALLLADIGAALRALGRWLATAVPVRLPHWRAVARALGLAGLAGLSFVVTGFGLSQLAFSLRPLNDNQEDITSKIAWYRAHRDEIDTLFVGSSRVATGIDPLAFDTERARLGCPSRSFNLGVIGLYYAEYLGLLEELARDPSPRLREVYFEPRVNGITGRFAGRRVRRFLALQRFPAIWREALTNPDTAEQAEAARRILLWATLQRNLGVGTLNDSLFSWTSSAPPAAWDATRGRDRPEARTPFPTTPQARRFEAMRDAWAATEVEAQAHGAGWGAVLADEARLVAALGGRATALAMPAVTWNEAAIRGALRRERPDQALIFLDPLTVPALYQPPLWRDDGHLNDAGSAMFSTLLARTTCP